MSELASEIGSRSGRGERLSGVRRHALGVRVGLVNAREQLALELEHRAQRDHQVVVLQQRVHVEPVERHEVQVLALAARHCDRARHHVRSAQRTCDR